MRVTKYVNTCKPIRGLHKKESKCTGFFYFNTPPFASKFKFSLRLDQISVLPVKEQNPPPVKRRLGDSKCRNFEYYDCVVISKKGQNATTQQNIFRAMVYLPQELLTELRQKRMEIVRL